MGHDNHDARDHSQRLPSFLFIYDAVLNAELPRIVEYRLGRFKTDPLFGQIALVLYLILLESHCAS
jgi:hypothetical protein